MSAYHNSYVEIARPRRGSTDYHEGYDEARRAFLIGQAVRERRIARACPRPNSLPAPA